MVSWGTPLLEIDAGDHKSSRFKYLFQGFKVRSKGYSFIPYYFISRTLQRTLEIYHGKCRWLQNGV